MLFAKLLSNTPIQPGNFFTLNGIAAIGVFTPIDTNPAFLSRLKKKILRTFCTFQYLVSAKSLYFQQNQMKISPGSPSISLSESTKVVTTTLPPNNQKANR